MADDHQDNSGNTIVQPRDKGVTAVYKSKRELMLANILGGIAWGFGTVIGATIVVALMLILLNYLGGVPIIGSFINDVAQSIDNARQ